MTKRRKLFIHAGLPKTGTTSIQVFLASHRKELLEQGFLYPEISPPAGNAGLVGTEIFMPEVHHSLALSHNPHNRESVKLALQKLGRDPWDIVKEQFEASGAQSIILSSEMFAMESRSINLREPLKIFDGFNLYVIFIVRRTDRWAESLYLQLISSHGRSKSFRTTGVLNNRRSRSFLHLAISTQKAIPDGRMVIKSFEELAADGELIFEFLKIIDDGLAIQLETAARQTGNTNESLAKQESLFLKKLNELGVEEDVFDRVRTVFWGNTGQWRYEWKDDQLTVIPPLEQVEMLNEYNNDVAVANDLFDSNLPDVDVALAAGPRFPFQEDIREDQSSVILGLLKDHIPQQDWDLLNERMSKSGAERGFDRAAAEVDGDKSGRRVPRVPLGNEQELRLQLRENSLQARPNYDLMRVLVDQERNEEALVFGLRALQRKSSNPNIFVDVLTLLATLKLTALVHTLAAEAVEDGIDDPRIFAALARSQAAGQDWDSAKRTLEVADRKHPDNKILQTTKAKLRALRVAEM